jgi:hypothetical protein
MSDGEKAVKITTSSQDGGSAGIEYAVCSTQRRALGTTQTSGDPHRHEINHDTLLRTSESDRGKINIGVGRIYKIVKCSAQTDWIHLQ